MSLDLSRNRLEGISGLSLIAPAQRNFFNKLINPVETSLPSPIFPTSPIDMHHFMQAGRGLGSVGDLNNFPSPYGYPSFSRTNGTPSPKSPQGRQIDNLSDNNDRKDEGKEVKSCLICGDRATGLHYGIISCEGCKGFFKRSICNKRVYRCTRSKNCVMSRKQRNRCQFCRLLKCLQMGMNRKAIREDGMPGGRNKSIGPVQISDEEIERILSGKDFEEEAAREELQREQQQLDASNSTYPLDYQMPGYLPFFTPTSSVRDPANLQTSNSSSPTMVNGFNRSVPSSTAASIKARSLLAGANAQSQFMSQFPGLALRDNSFYSNVGANAFQLPQLNRYASMSQNQNLFDRSPSAAAELTSNCLVDQLVKSENVSDLPQLEAKRFANENVISKADLFHVLCKIADEMLHRQIIWIKKLPFFENISIKDHTTLLSTTWAEIMLLAALCLHEEQLFGDLAELTAKYVPDRSELSFGSLELEILERVTSLYNKFSNLKVDKEEYVIMKVINFLNQDIKGLQEVERVEEINKRYWYACQRFIELRALERNTDQPNSPPSTSSGAARFTELMLCLPDVRFIAGRLLNSDISRLPLLLKAILHSCKYQKELSARQTTRNNSHSETPASTPPSPTSSPQQSQAFIVRENDKMATAASMLDLTSHRQIDLANRRHDSSGSVGPPSTSSTASSGGALNFSGSPRSVRDGNIESS